MPRTFTDRAGAIGLVVPGKSNNGLWSLSDVSAEVDVGDHLRAATGQLRPACPTGLQKIQVVAVVHRMHRVQFMRCKVASFEFDHVMAGVTGCLQQDFGSLGYLLCIGNATLE